MQPTRTLQDWLSWIEANHPSEIALGLDRSFVVARQLGLPLSVADRAAAAKPSTVITVAGTNGKGSCVAALNAILVAAGYRVGCYTSPHFLHYNERIQINGQPVTDDALIAAFSSINQAQGDTPLTYFEYGTLAALEIFRQQSLDVLLLEVGLGGRLDAVNIVDADVAIITSIALDHQDWLGNDREQIGREKAGIFRHRQLAICADPNPPQSVLHAAADCQASLSLIGRDFSIQKHEQGAEQPGSEVLWQSSDAGTLAGTLTGTILKIPRPDLPWPSVAAALQAVHQLRLAVNDFSILADIALPGRYQQEQLEERTVILDVAHNPAAALYLAQRLRNDTENGFSGRTLALFAVMADKDVAAIVDSIGTAIDSWLLADLPTVPRARPASDVADIIHAAGHSMVSVSKTVCQAYRQAQSIMSADDRLVVFGSFYTVAEMLKIIDQTRPAITSGESSV